MEQIYCVSCCRVGSQAGITPKHNSYLLSMHTQMYCASSMSWRLIQPRSDHPAGFVLALEPSRPNSRSGAWSAGACYQASHLMGGSACSNNTTLGLVCGAAPQLGRGPRRELAVIAGLPLDRLARLAERRHKLELECARRQVHRDRPAVSLLPGHAWFTSEGASGRGDLLGVSGSCLKGRGELRSVCTSRAAVAKQVQRPPTPNGIAICCSKGRQQESADIGWQSAVCHSALLKAAAMLHTPGAAAVSQLPSASAEPTALIVCPKATPFCVSIRTCCAAGAAAVPSSVLAVARVA